MSHARNVHGTERSFLFGLNSWGKFVRMAGETEPTQKDFVARIRVCQLSRLSRRQLACLPACPQPPRHRPPPHSRRGWCRRAPLLPSSWRPQPLRLPQPPQLSFPTLRRPPLLPRHTFSHAEILLDDDYLFCGPWHVKAWGPTCCCRVKHACQRQQSWAVCRARPPPHTVRPGRLLPTANILSVCSHSFRGLHACADRA